MDDAKKAMEQSDIEQHSFKGQTDPLTHAHSPVLSLLQRDKLDENVACNGEEEKLPRNFTQGFHALLGQTQCETGPAALPSLH